MTNTYKRKLETIETLATMADIESLTVSHGGLLELAESLHKWARKVDAGNLAACNGIPRYDDKARQVLASWTAEDDAKRDATRDKARAAITRALSDAFGTLPAGRVNVSLQGDPRGAPVILTVESSFGQPREWRFS